MIALVDYGAGNLTSVRKALVAVGAEFFVPTAPDELRGASAAIVPGVGHFSATRTLGPEWVRALRALVADGRPLLGICVGMQWLYEGSDEAPDVAGLGAVGGRCFRLSGRSPEGALPEGVLKVPHVGWNTLAP
jgi:glutamine amidotransferase